jgi:hypothetical protein
VRWAWQAGCALVFWGGRRPAAPQIG